MKLSFGFIHTYIAVVRLCTAKTILLIFNSCQGWNAKENYFFFLFIVLV